MSTHKPIEVRLAGTREVRSGTEPLTFGVPFAEGALELPAAIRVAGPDGRPIPAQTDCLTTWRKDRRHVKWLLVDVQADGRLEPGAALSIEYPHAAEPAADDAGPHIRTTESDDLLSVDTGALRIDFRRSFDAGRPPASPAAISRCLVKTRDGWQDVLRGDGPVLYMKDAHGTRYDSLSSGFAPEVVLEEAGPLRACVLVKGFLASATGIRFCPYQLRMHLYAGMADLRVFHTFVFDHDPRRVELSAVGIDLPLELGDRLRAAAGSDDDDAAHWCERWETLAVLQDDDRRYTVLRDGRPFGAGTRMPGWVSLSGSRASAAVAVRDGWQEFPKGFTLSERGIDVGIWPEACGRTLAFSTPYEETAVRFAGMEKSSATRSEAEVVEILARHPTAPLNLKSFNIRSLEEARWVEEMVEKHAPGRTISYNDTNTQNGVGAAKTTEIVIRFSAEPAGDAAAQAFCDAVQEPLRAVVDPEHLCATGAVDHFYPAGNPRMTGPDADLDDYFEPIVVDPVERCRLYGMMRFGNAVCVHSSAVGWVYLLYKDSDPAKALRYVGPYNNEANDQIMGVWGQYLRTGDPRYLRIAERYSRIVADVGFVHAFPGHPERVGVMHYHNAHQWSGGYSPSHSILSGILTDYYLTGNRRLLEVAREAADRIVRTQEPASILSCRHVGLHREFTGPLSMLLDVYQATWDEKYGLLAERSLNWMLRVVREPGMLPNGIGTGGVRGDEAMVTPDSFPEVAWGNKYHLYAPALRCFPSAALKEFLIAEADYWVWQSPKSLFNYACSTVCFAYDLSHRPEYAYYAAHLLRTHLREAVDDIRQERDFDFSLMRLSGFIPRLMRIVACEMDRDPDGFESGLSAWVAKREAMPDRPEAERPDTATPVSLGVLSTEPHPVG